MYNIIKSYFIKNVIILFVINNFLLNQKVSYIKLKYLKLLVFKRFILIIPKIVNQYIYKYYFKDDKSMIILLF